MAEQQSVPPIGGEAAAELGGGGSSDEWRAITPLVKRVGPLVAWAVAGASGWSMAERMDLLEAVLRAGIVWVTVVVLWIGGVSLIERLLEQAAEGTPQEGTASEG